MEKRAFIDGPYRYCLTRERNPWLLNRFCTFIMLNPSTADAEVDDPTIRRCMDFADNLGYENLAVVNLFAYRATNPKELLSAQDPVGPANNIYIKMYAGMSDMVIAAWGANAFAKPRAYEVYCLLLEMGIAPRCLRKTKDGSPGHPLYLPKTVMPMYYYGQDCEHYDSL